MSQAYPNDIPYPPVFHREMTPVWIDAVLRGLGQEGPDLAGAFRWCELGCGPGLNAVVTAAAHPAAHVTAIDLNAAHLARARAWAEAAGLPNLETVQAGFTELAEAPPDRFGPFDVIVTHGVLSWIAPAEREALLRFIGRFLRPGGVVYAHYMTHPGMSAAAAGQRLARRVAARAEGGPVERAQAALAFQARLAAGGAGFFVAHPQERHRLEASRRQDPAALAHELLPAHWEPFHVAEIIEVLGRQGCRYLGSATPLDNIDAVSLPAGTLPLLAGLDDPALAETVRDMARNQSLRRDLYRSGGAPLPAGRHWQALAELPLALLPAAPRRGPLRFDTPIGPVQGEAALFDPLLAALRRGPCRVGDLARHGAHPAQLNQAVQMLIWSGCAHPVRSPLPDPQAAWRLNRALCASGVGWLAAPALGGALPVAPELMPAVAALLEAAGPEATAPEPATPERLRENLRAWRAFGALPPEG